jgi:agmatinase
MKSSLTVLESDRNFLGIDPCGLDEAEALILPVPLELTTSYLKGTRNGPEALLQASHQVELFDDELKCETFQRGIATIESMKFFDEDSEEAISKIQKELDVILQYNKKTVVIGGEHSVTVGAVRSFSNFYPDMSVIHLDAHADLRDSYLGSPYNHACVMARVREKCPFVSIGIRSLCQEEFRIIQKEDLNIYDIHQIRTQPDWMEQSLSQIGDHVYLTIDLDVFDPSLIPSVGTPEPNGLLWIEFYDLMKRIFNSKTVVGFDVVELCPRPGAEYGVFSAAKIIYRLLGYWFYEECEQIP